MSDKEDCFEEALRSWETMTGRDLGVTFQQPWIKDAAGLWERGSRTWWALVNSWRKTLRFFGGDAEEPGTVQGLRRPDITMPGANGKDVVVDLKFTGANGKPDPWRTGQEQAYGDINKQNHGPNSGAVALDKHSCKCDGEPEREPVEVADPYLAPYGLPQPAPGFRPQTVPEGAPVPVRPTIPVRPSIPLRLPLFEPVLP